MVDITALVKAIDKKMAEYYVTAGSTVRMNGGGGAWLVTNVIFSDEMRRSSPEQKVWGVFCLISVVCGTNWEVPIPHMSEGSADIRLLMGGPDQRITDVIFQSSRKNSKGMTIRTYKVIDSRNEITRITVTR